MLGGVAQVGRGVAVGEFAPGAGQVALRACPFARQFGFRQGARHRRVAGQRVAQVGRAVAVGPQAPGGGQHMLRPGPVARVLRGVEDPQRGRGTGDRVPCVGRLVARLQVQPGAGQVGLRHGPLARQRRVTVDGGRVARGRLVEPSQRRLVADDRPPLVPDGWRAGGRLAQRVAQPQPPAHRLPRAQAQRVDIDLGGPVLQRRRRPRRSVGRGRAEPRPPVVQRRDRLCAQPGGPLGAARVDRRGACGRRRRQRFARALGEVVVDGGVDVEVGLVAGLRLLFRNF